MPNYIKIGLFSKIAQVTVRTLRHYDDIGLFKPAYIEQSTNYRYYTYDQLIRLNQILVLKEIGFSLEEISSMVQKDMSIDDLKGMMHRKKEALAQQIQEAAQQIRGIETRLNQLSQIGQKSNYNVVLKQSPAQHIIALRRIVPKPQDMYGYRSRMFHELNDWIARMKYEVHQELVFYHMNEFIEENFDMEAAYTVHNPMVKPYEDGEIRLYEIPAEPLVASLVYNGPFHGIGEALQELFTYLGLHGYTPTGSVREIHLFGQENSHKDCNHVLMELQVPIAK